MNDVQLMQYVKSSEAMKKGNQHMMKAPVTTPKLLAVLNSLAKRFPPRLDNRCFDEITIRIPTYEKITTISGMRKPMINVKRTLHFHTKKTDKLAVIAAYAHNIGIITFAVSGVIFVWCDNGLLMAKYLSMLMNIRLTMEHIAQVISKKYQEACNFVASIPSGRFIQPVNSTDIQNGSVRSATRISATARLTIKQLVTPRRMRL